MNEEIIKSIFNINDTTLQIKLDILDVYLEYRKGARILCYLNNQVEEVTKKLMNAQIQISVGKGLVSQSACSSNNVKDYFDSTAENIEKVIPLYISKSQDYADKLREADESKDDVKFGGMLDYPKCCIKKVAEAGYVPSIIESFNYLQVNEKYNVWAWPVAMIGDASLLVHYPCSINCEESMLLAKKHFQIISEFAPKSIVDRVKKYHHSFYSLRNRIINIHETIGDISPLNTLYEVS
jgi:hypothetical protein